MTTHTAAKARNSEFKRNVAQVDRALKGLDSKVSPVVKSSTEALVQQYSKTLKKLASE